MVTRPFSFEGKRRAVQAESGIEELRNECDTLIVIPNDRLLQLGDRSVSMMDAFRTADQVLLSGVQGITDLITTPGLINLDFADVKWVMTGAGLGADGHRQRARRQPRGAGGRAGDPSPLLEASMDGAHGVLLSIAGGSDLGLFEINEAASLVTDAAHPDANIIFGAVIDDALGDEVRVTVIAAGFDGGTPTHKKLEPTAVRVAARPPGPDVAASRRPSTAAGHSRARQAGTLPPAAPYSRPPPRTRRGRPRRAVPGSACRRSMPEPPAATLPAAAARRAGGRTSPAASSGLVRQRLLAELLRERAVVAAEGRRPVGLRRGARRPRVPEALSARMSCGRRRTRARHAPRSVRPRRVVTDRRGGRSRARTTRSTSATTSATTRPTSPPTGPRLARELGVPRPAGLDGPGARHRGRGGRRPAGPAPVPGRPTPWSRRRPGLVLCVLVADCVPVLLADPRGRGGRRRARRPGGRAAGRRRRRRCRRWRAWAPRAPT